MSAAVADGDWKVALPEGPLDIVGDVHGELDALRALMARLGYAPDGTHPESRHLVFVGDLTDRGPDSPGVVALVRSLVEAGSAHCAMGNHELNLIRDDPKAGNGWAFARNHDAEQGRYQDSRDATPSERAAIRDFFSRLPLVLENRALRVVHAAWHPESMRQIEELQAGHTPLSLFMQFERDEADSEDWQRLKRQAEAAERKLGQAIADLHWKAAPMPALAERDERKQMGNPLRVLTSGVERVAQRPFFTSHKWRFVERVPWWDTYRDTKPVVVGHYWRKPPGAIGGNPAKGAENLFAGIGPCEWHGARRNVFCIDYSAGARSGEREREEPLGSRSALAALRWVPGAREHEIVLDHGRMFRSGPSGV